MTKRSRLFLFGFSVAMAAAVSCSATRGGNTFPGDDDDDEGSTSFNDNSGGAGPTGGTSEGIGGSFVGSGGSGNGGGSAACDSGPNDDKDADGFTGAQGDCNDCDPNVNPGALEVVNNQPGPDGVLPPVVDEDCDGAADNPPPSTCDDNIALTDFDPMNGARAIDLCQVAEGKKWGVLDAQYVRGNYSKAPQTAAVGIFSDFGPNVQTQGGTRMLGLSSGYARLPSQPGACGSNSCSAYGPGTAPPGFPQDNPSCPVSDSINDDIGLQVKVRTPKNATGYEFRFKFYSFEYPEWVCDNYNDQFIALIDPAPKGSINGNISFDKNGSPVSVNIAFFDVCDGCALGAGEMQGTGFNQWDDAGGTAWLKTQAPVTGGEEITLRFMIWDTGDSAWDSTALVDGFRWIANGGSVVVTTDPADPPK
jgi:hypothetical protein